ncbi:cytochrome P450 [Aspergillus fijiensis CBS 313.89]|uniref:Cytochrome P450 n=1 Tax=Aspergillus fijiensis CBS 313.89 TaxID=1448319 RepID=A0A8G1VV13_9EURO|nr:cytochrome P450 [Aspergillus fijiensis CBS 313.89]RAK72706.1 cytochrome P450 [Aspergillus fijiensis CBS 313.89]
MLVLLVVVAIFAAAVIYDRYFHPLAKFPGPAIAAASPLWAMHARYSGRLLPKLRDLHEKYGPVVRISPNELSFASPRARDAIYKDEYTKGFTPTQNNVSFAIDVVIGDTTAQSATSQTDHRSVRSQVKGILATYPTPSQEQIHQTYLMELEEELDTAARGGTQYDLTAGMDRLIWQCMGHFFLGHSIPISTKETFDYFRRWDNVYTAGLDLMFYIGRLPGASAVAAVLLRTIRNLMTTDWVQVNTFSRIQELTDRKEFRESIVAQKLGIVDGADGKPELKRAMAHISLLVIGGYDPVSAAASAVFYYLLQHPKALATLKHELRTASPREEACTDEKLSQIAYLNACIQESLRLQPPVNDVGARISTGIEVDAVYVPKGAKVFVDKYSIHRSARYFRDPERWDPERWLATTPESDLAAFSAFSVGTHACPGRIMGLRVLRLTIAKLLLSYDFQLADSKFDWDRDAHCCHVWQDFRVDVKVSKVGAVQ